MIKVCASNAPQRRRGRNEDGKAHKRIFINKLQNISHIMKNFQEPKGIS